MGVEEERDGWKERETDREGESMRDEEKERERISARRGVRVGIKVKHIKNSPAGPTHS